LVVGLLFAGAVLYASRRTRTDTVETSGQKVLAVLPFENLGDSADAYFADGVSDAVRTKLARIAGLYVIARGSSLEYRKTNKRPQDIARELGADYLLTATVQWDKSAGGASRVRVSPELVTVSSREAPKTRWGEQFDAAVTDVFQVQAELASNVASALGVALGDSARQELASKPTGSFVAYDAFLKGEAASQSMAENNPPSLRRAAGFYEQAVAVDSTFFLAWAQLARVYSTLSFTNPSRVNAERAHAALKRALALGSNRPEAQLALGEYHQRAELDHVTAIAAYEAGVRQAPNSIELLMALATAEQALGRWEASVEPLTRAAALDPRSVNAVRRISNALLCLRRYEAADSMADRALAVAPTNLRILEQKITVSLARGDLAAAKQAVRFVASRVESAELVAHLASFAEFYWLLDDVQQRQLLTLPPSAFDNDSGTWAIVRAQTYHFRHDQTHARAFADLTQRIVGEQIRVTPDNGQLRITRGLALAYLSRKSEALREGERGVTLWPVTRDALVGYYIAHQRVRIHLLVGEYEGALDQLERLLKLPGYLSPGRLRIDPTFAPLHNSPRFQRLLTTSFG
jgi:TolB-like protein/Tfp pilus assembly protein PilF